MATYFREGGPHDVVVIVDAGVGSAWEDQQCLLHTSTRSGESIADEDDLHYPHGIRREDIENLDCQRGKS